MEGALYERILIPLDGSEAAEAVLPLVEKLAAAVHAEVLLLRVIEPLSAAEAVAAAGVVAPDTLLLRELEAKRYLGEVERRLTHEGLTVRTAVRRGPPASEIVAAAAESAADLIAMTTHGRSGLGRVLFGSVAEAALRAATVPVLLIRAAAGAHAAARGASGR